MDIDSQAESPILGEQLRCVEAMLETLNREHQALVDGGPDELELATDAKSKLVEALERLEAQRPTLAAARAPQRGDASGAAEWQRLRELLAQCKEQNQRNGALLKARSDHVRVALKTLRGAEPDLYSATGRTPSRADARPLGTA